MKTAPDVPFRKREHVRENDGDFNVSKMQAGKVLAKVPAHGPASQLVVRIALARREAIAKQS